MNKGIRRAGTKHMKVGVTEMQGYRVEMEDAHSLVMELDETKTKSLFAVYDGHGGRRASLFLAENLHKFLEKLTDFKNTKLIEETMLKVDQAFIDSVEGDIKNHGSTCVWAVVEQNSNAEDSKKTYDVTIASIGDSRAIIMKADGSHISVTKDHKPENRNEYARIVRADGHVASNRVDGMLAMSRAIGDYSYKKNPNIDAVEQKVIAVPDVFMHTLEEGDILLLICDGIVEQMSNEDAVAYCQKEIKEARDKGQVDPAAIVSSLCNYSVRRGSKDNHSALMVMFEDGADWLASSKLPDKDYWPGAYDPYKRSSDFTKAFWADAEKYGYKRDDEWVLARAKDAEKTAASAAETAKVEEHPVEDDDDDDDDDGANSELMQKALEAVMSGSSANSAEFQTRILAILNGQNGSLPMAGQPGGQLDLEFSEESHEDDEMGLEDADEAGDKINAAPNQSAAEGKKKGKKKNKK